MRNIRNILILLLAAHSSILCQDSTQYLPTTTISSNRIEEARFETAKSVSTLTAKQLQEMPVQSVQEALQYIAGIQIQSRSLPFVQADINIRGGTFDQVLVLVDGVQLTDAQTGHHLLNIPVPLSAIERIEIIRGPSAREYGPNALAGVIHIITKKSNPDGLELGMYGGSFGTLGIEAYTTMRSQSWQHQFAYRKDVSEGYRKNTDYDIDHLYYSAHRSFGTQSIRFQGGLSLREFGANGFYAGLQFTDQYEEVQTSFAALQHQWTGKQWVWKTNVFWRRNQDMYVFLRHDPNFYRNMHIANTYGIESHIQYQSQWGTTGVGFQVRREGLRSNLLGRRERLATNIHLEHRITFAQERLQLTPGILVSYYSDQGEDILPGLDISFQVRPQWQFFASVGRTFRVPTYTDLYYESPSEKGNPSLESEKALNLEMGMRIGGPRWQWETAAFSRQVENGIDWFYSSTDSLWQVQNLLGITFRGLETSFRYQNSSKRAIHLRSAAIQYAFIEGVVAESQNNGLSRYSFTHLRHHCTGQISFQFPLGLQLQTNYRFAVPFRTIQSSPYVMEDYHILDVKLSHRRKKVTLFVEILNATNATYVGANLIPMPGRNWRIGASFRWHRKELSS